MASQQFFGMYARFTAETKDHSATLLSADSLPGDILSFEFEDRGGITIAYLKNRFGYRCGCLDPAMSNKMNVFRAREWECRAVMSFVAIDSKSDYRHWGEVALICYPKNKAEVWERWTNKIAKEMKQGRRPDVNLGSQAIAQVIESNGEWLPSKKVSFPKGNSTVQILKKQYQPMDHIIEAARAKNPGCYVITWAFFIGLAALIALFVKGCVG